MGNGLIWGDVATWVTGIATIALFIIGFLQIRNERLSRIKRGAEIEVRNRRNQAEQISSWIVKEDQHGSWIAILNQSPQPIYQVIVNVVVVGQLGEDRDYNPAGQRCVGIAPPGRGYIAVQAPYHGMFRRPGIEIAFKDTSGRNWVRKANGELSEIEKSTVEYYKVGLPTSWSGLAADMPPTETINQNNLDD